MATKAKRCVKRKPVLPAVTYDKLVGLANLLKLVPKDNYDQNNWRCGSAACAAGWGALCGLFPELKFRRRINPFGVRRWYLLDSEGQDIIWSGLVLPGLSLAQKERLFGACTGDDPVQKARQIRKFLKRYRKERRV